MKIMAIDYGDAHTGVAISDRTLTLTGFSTVITAYRPEAVIEKLLPLISEHEVSELVLGHPLNMDGSRVPARGKGRGLCGASARGRVAPRHALGRTAHDRRCAQYFAQQRQARQGAQENRRRRGSKPDA